MDLCIVACRRPDLLAQTLDGFGPRIFSHLPIGRVVANIDPVFGGATEHAACVDILRARFPDATIFEPETPGFAAAVRRVWAATTGDLVFHMEDDWQALRDVGPDALRPFDDARGMQVSLHTAERNWDLARKGPLHRRRDYIHLFGLKLPRFTSFPKFSTSPSVLRGDFARRCAALMDPAFDPEKQFYSGLNAALEAYVGGFENYIYSPDGKPVIIDLGRPWAASHGIRKQTVAGVSSWQDGKGAGEGTP